MESRISYCGIMCAGCPVLWATYEKDAQVKEKMRVEIAKMSNNLYGTQFDSKDIGDCDGCMTENGRLFPGCNNCQIRICAMNRKIPNCAYCNEFMCETLQKFLIDNPESKTRLDFIRSIR